MTVILYLTKKELNGKGIELKFRKDSNVFDRRRLLAKAKVEFFLLVFWTIVVRMTRVYVLNQKAI